MTTWAKDELEKFARTDDLHISPFREDGNTYGTPTWIWSVVVDGDLYVRAYNGRNSRWHRAAMEQKAGRITAAGMTVEVAFEPVDGVIQDRIDDAYRSKYKGSEYLPPMIGARAKSATVRVTPRKEVEGKERTECHTFPSRYGLVSPRSRSNGWPTQEYAQGLLTELEAARPHRTDLGAGISLNRLDSLCRHSRGGRNSLKPLFQ